MCASVTGANIPAAAQVAPWPGVGSQRTTFMPFVAALQAIDMPITPPPATTTSGTEDDGTEDDGTEDDGTEDDGTEDEAGGPDTRCILRKLLLGQSRPGRSTGIAC